MDLASTLAYLPLAAMLAGILAGLVAGRLFVLRRALWLIAGLSLAALVLIVQLAGVPEGREAEAFQPFVVLTGALFPALFGAIVGLVGGNALRRRAVAE